MKLAPSLREHSICCTNGSPEADVVWSRSRAMFHSGETGVLVALLASRRCLGCPVEARLTFPGPRGRPGQRIGGGTVELEGISELP